MSPSLKRIAPKGARKQQRIHAVLDRRGLRPACTAHEFCRIPVLFGESLSSPVKVRLSSPPAHQRRLSHTSVSMVKFRLPKCHRRHLLNADMKMLSPAPALVRPSSDLHKATNSKDVPPLKKQRRETTPPAPTRTERSRAETILKHRTASRPRGLENWHRACFSNAALQCLHAIPSFVKSLQDVPRSSYAQKLADNGFDESKLRQMSGRSRNASKLRGQLHKAWDAIGGRQGGKL